MWVCPPISPFKIVQVFPISRAHAHDTPSPNPIPPYISPTVLQNDLKNKPSDKRQENELIWISGAFSATARSLLRLALFSWCPVSYSSLKKGREIVCIHLQFLLLLVSMLDLLKDYSLVHEWISSIGSISLALKPVCHPLPHFCVLAHLKDWRNKKHSHTHSDIIRFIGSIVLFFGPWTCNLFQPLQTFRHVGRYCLKTWNSTETC